MNIFFANFASIMWGPWLLILLLGVGFWLTFRLGGIQFRNLFYALRLAFSKERAGEGDISHFGALMTAMAATVGMGNIAGVGTAVALGGPGAIFWMWVTGLVGMATKYSESFLAVKYRQVNEHGEISGGPMYYLEHGLGQKWLGMCFAVFGSLAAFGTGNMIQANTAAIAVVESLGSTKFSVGLILSVLTGLVIIGGIKRISDVASIFVPIMVAIYFVGALIVILSHLGQLGVGLKLIFEDAFNGTAATGGFIGATLVQTIRYGVARGPFFKRVGNGKRPYCGSGCQNQSTGETGAGFYERNVPGYLGRLLPHCVGISFYRGLGFWRNRSGIDPTGFFGGPAGKLGSYYCNFECNYFCFFNDFSLRILR